MKKNFIIALTALCIVSASAFAQVKFAVTGGASISNVVMKEMNTPTYKLKNKAGITGGIRADIPAGSHFSLQSGLNFVQKGTRDKSETPLGDYKYSLTLNYLEMPLNLLYNTHHKSGNFFIGAGPSLSCGINGNYQVEVGSDKEKVNIHFGKDEDEARRFDMGANLVTGYRFGNGIFASINYNHGLTNLDRDADPDDKESVKTRYLGIRIGYQFGRRK